MQDIIPPNQNFDQSSDYNLKLISYCPVCHLRYDPLEAKVLDEKNGAHLIHFRCKRCQSAILALVVINNFGLSSVGMITDLDYAEIERFRRARPLQADDAIELYELLSQKNLAETLWQN